MTTSCARCGSQNTDDAKFCGVCGVKLEPAPAPSQLMAAPATQTAVLLPRGVFDPSDPSMRMPVARGASIVVVLIVLLLDAGLATAGVLLMRAGLATTGLPAAGSGSGAGSASDAGSGATPGEPVAGSATAQGPGGSSGSSSHGPGSASRPSSGRSSSPTTSTDRAQAPTSSGSSGSSGSSPGSGVAGAAPGSGAAPGAGSSSGSTSAAVNGYVSDLFGHPTDTGAHGSGAPPPPPASPTDAAVSTSPPPTPLAPPDAAATATPPPGSSPVDAVSAPVDPYAGNPPPPDAAPAAPAAPDPTPPDAAPASGDEDDPHTVDLAAEVDRKTEQSKPRFDRCYSEAAKAYTPDQPLAGEVDIAFRVMPTGEVQNAEAVKNTTDSHALADCVVGVIASWKFSASDLAAPAAFVRPLRFDGS